MLKIASGAASGRTFSAPGSFFVQFGVPAGPQNGAKTAPGAREILFFWPPFLIFLHSYRSGVFRKGPGALPEAPGTLPE